MENPNIYIDTNLEAEAKAICTPGKGELISAKYDETGLKFSKDGKRLLKCKKNMDDSYTIPEGVEAICDQAFKGVTNLISIHLPNSIKYIGDGAFESTKNLKSINFPENIQFIGVGAFLKSGLENLDLSHTLIKTIKVDSFSGCVKLNTLDLPSTLQSIEYGAFDEVSFDLATNSKNFVIENGGIYNADRSVLYTSLIGGGHFIVPNTVKSIRPWCFKFCDNIQIVFEEGSTLEEIGDEAFGGVNAHTIKLPGTLKRIGNRVFEYCDIEVIKLPESLEEIGSKAFEECISLKEIWLPSSLKFIGEQIFYNADSLEYIDVAKGEKKRFCKLLPEYKSIIVERDFDDFLLEDYHCDDWDEEDDIVEDEVEFDYVDEEDRNEENEEQITEEETNCVDDETKIEIWNDVNWKQIGFSLDSTNVEVVGEYEFSLFLEISGKLKVDFSLSCALYDHKGKIRKVEWLTNYFTSIPKYQKKINKIISKNFYLHFPVKEIRRIRLFVD